MHVLTRAAPAVLVNSRSGEAGVMLTAADLAAIVEQVSGLWEYLENHVDSTGYGMFDDLLCRLGGWLDLSSAPHCFAAEQSRSAAEQGRSEVKRDGA